jgi:yeast amino acid transporter
MPRISDDVEKTVTMANSKRPDASTDSDLGRLDTNASGPVVGSVTNTDHLQRHLGYRQVQLIAIGSSIGTATFVTIGQGLMKGLC